MKNFIYILIVFFTACTIPQDPNNTLENVKKNGIRVGVLINPPFTYSKDNNYMGIDIDILKKISSKLNTKLIFIQKNEQDLMQDLKNYKVDIIVGGISEDNPWIKEVGKSKIYFKEDDKKYIFAMPKGENAWIVYVDKILGGQND